MALDNSSWNFSRISLVMLLFLQQQQRTQVVATATAEQPVQQQQQSDKPNIIIILVDDMGFNDVSFHGSNQILTPNIDALAYNGIILNRLYVPNLCTPSRATLLTGKYPSHTGTQHHVIVNDEPWGLPLTERLMPEFFRAAGYSTNLVGKWHLGFWRKELIPTMRGFDHHCGYYSGYIDYYNHNMFMVDRNYSTGLDFRRDLSPWPEANGTYATDAFTAEAARIISEHDTQKPLFLLMSHLAVHTANENDPMQEPPNAETSKFSHISDKNRRTYAAMISRLDRSVGETIRALSDKGMLNNTIVLLYSDNGAPTLGQHSNAGSNYPFRGQKYSPWEGGIRSAGAIWSPLLQRKGYVSNQLIHAIDWLPTLASVAGVQLPGDLKIDGVDVWHALTTQADPQPRPLLHSLDDIVGYSSYTEGEWKYINGTTTGGQFDTWLGDLDEHEVDPRAAYYVQEILNSEVHKIIGDSQSINKLSPEIIEKLRTQATHQCPVLDVDPNAELYLCEPLKAPCLFHLANDPCERYNLAQLHPLQMQLLAQAVDRYRLTAVPSARVVLSDAASDPALHRGNWEWWYVNHGVSLFRPSSLKMCLWFVVVFICGRQLAI